MKLFFPRQLHFMLLTVFILSLFCSAWASDSSTQEVLVTINNNLVVTDKDLEQALRSSPFYTQFNTMEEGQQASLRGNILKRLVTSRLLSIEAQQAKLEQSSEFKKEIDNFRKGLLYRAYMEQFKSSISIPQLTDDALRNEYKGNRDGYKAAKSSYISKQYRLQYEQTLKLLRDRYHVRLYESRVTIDNPSDTIVLEADAGIQIRLADIIDPQEAASHRDQLLEKIYQLAELLVVAQAAQDAAMDVSAQVNGYRQERLPAMFLEHKQQQWLAEKNVLRNYYVQHPEASFIPQRWHLGMIVLSTEQQAKQVLARINQGESLFKLAGELSIDPYGREHRGDMGWVREQSGDPRIENAIKNLADGQNSQIIKTEKGYIIATILDRRPGGKRHFISMKDKIAQLVIDEKMHHYLQELQSRYEVSWRVLAAKTVKSS